MKIMFGGAAFTATFHPKGTLTINIHTKTAMNDLATFKRSSLCFTEEQPLPRTSAAQLRVRQLD
jgi:hypothetical protein